MPQLKTTNQEFSHWIIASPTPGTDRRRRSIDAQGDGMAVHAIGKQGFKVQSNSGICYVLRRPQSSLRGRVRVSTKRREGAADCGAVDSVRDDVR